MKTEKICRGCNTVKKLEEFARDKKASDKRTTRSLECTRQYKKNRFKQEIVAFDYYE